MCCGRTTTYVPAAKAADSGRASARKIEQSSGERYEVLDQSGRSTRRRFTSRIAAEGMARRIGGSVTTV